MILVTGGTGLIGSHLLYELTKRGHNVKALKRETSNISKTLQVFRYYGENVDELFSRIEWVNGDILDPFALQEIISEGDEVYHAAALVSFTPGLKRRIFANNIAGTANIVNACLVKKAKKLCHVSSVAAMGTPNDGSPVDETLIWSPSKKHSSYSISKFHSEMEVWRGIEEGLKAVIVNPSVVLGAGHWDSGSSAIFPKIYKGLQYYTPGTAGYVDVRDVVNIMIRLMESDISGERFLLNAENIPFKKLFQSIAGNFQKRIPSVEIKPWMATVAWIVDKFTSLIIRKDPELSRELISAGFSKMNYANRKIISALRYDFIPVEESLKHICSLYNN